jgi:cytochrome c
MQDSLASSVGEVKLSAGLRAGLYFSLIRLDATCSVARRFLVFNHSKKKPSGELFMRRSIGLAGVGLAILAAAAFIASSLGAPAASYAQSAGDAAKGKKIFARCAACHALEAGTNKIGPSLHGIMGRKSGSVEGFKYSDAMKGANLTWDEATLDKYLTDPKGFVPGNKMVFPGLKKPDDRANVIAYLKEASGS